MVDYTVMAADLFEFYSVMLIASLILGASAFACHGRRLTGGQRISVDEPGCSPGGFRVSRHAQPGEIRLTDVDV